MKSILLALTLLFTIQSQARDTKFDVKNMEKWADLQVHIEKNGELMETQFGDYLSLSDVNPNDRNQPRVANYISLVGGMSQEGKFSTGRLESVWEDWKFDKDNNFRIDQWLFVISVEGQVIGHSRSILVLTQTGQYVRSEYPKTSDEEYKTKWFELEDGWLAKSGLN
jgi:hypothetical protein